MVVYALFGIIELCRRNYQDLGGIDLRLILVLALGLELPF
jgi:hypothetical protein